MNYLAIMTMAAVLSGGEAGAQEDFRWSGRIAPGNEIRIQGIAGDVRAELSSGDRVEVVARRLGRDASRVEVEAVETARGVTICAVYPGSRAGGSGGCPSRGGDGSSIRDARVDFVVRVPAGVRLNVGVVEGDVSATGLRSPVEVSTVSGDVRIATTGPARASTVSGDIEAAFGAGEGRETAFNSVSGDIVLRLASGYGAEVRANTLSGDIESDFQLDRGARNRSRSESRGVRVDVRIGSQASGTIGRGGPPLTVNTLSGDIRILGAR